MFDSSGRHVLRGWQEVTAECARYRAIIRHCLPKQERFLMATFLYAWQDVVIVRNLMHVFSRVFGGFHAVYMVIRVAGDKKSRNGGSCVRIWHTGKSMAPMVMITCALRRECHDSFLDGKPDMSLDCSDVASQWLLNRQEAREPRRSDSSHDCASLDCLYSPGIRELDECLRVRASKAPSICSPTGNGRIRLSACNCSAV